MTRRPGLGSRLQLATHHLFAGTRFGRALDALAGTTFGQSAYKGARTHRGNADWPTGTRSARQELEPSLRALRARARDLSKNNPYAQSFLTLLDSFVVSPNGITVRSDVRNSRGEPDTRANAIIDEAWEEYIASPITLDRSLDYAGALSHAQGNWAIDGEVLVRLCHGADHPHGLAIQLIDADALDERFSRPRGREGNEIRMSVEINDAGVPVAYHVAKQPDMFWTYLYGNDRESLPAWDPFTRRGEVLHAFYPTRISDPRGVSWFHAVMESMDSMEAFSEASLWGAKLAAASTLLISPGEDSTDDEDAKATPPEQLELELAAAYRLRKGDTASFWEPKTNALSVFGDFNQEHARRLAVGLGPQHYMMSHNLESTSFSSMRGGELQNKPLFTSWQQGLTFKIVRPVREAWIKNAILSGRLKALDSINPGRFYGAVYRGTGTPYVNPIDEIRADALAIQCGITSPQRIHARQGPESWKKTIDEIAEARAYAASKDVNIDPPAGVAAQVAVQEAVQQAGGGSDGNGKSGKDALPEAIRRRLAHVNGGTRS